MLYGTRRPVGSLMSAGFPGLQSAGASTKLPIERTGPLLGSVSEALTAHGDGKEGTRMAGAGGRWAERRVACDVRRPVWQVRLPSRAAAASRGLLTPHDAIGK